MPEEDCIAMAGSLEVLQTKTTVDDSCLDGDEESDDSSQPAKILERLARLATGVYDDIRSVKCKLKEMKSLSSHKVETIDSDAATAMLSIGAQGAVEILGNKTTKTNEPQNLGGEISNCEPDAELAVTIEAKESDSEMAAKNGRSRRRSSRKSTLSLNANETSEVSSFVKYINRIVSEYLGGDIPPKLIFDGVVEDLEKYAQLLQNEGIGRIVETEIRVNHKNNRQSFIRMSTDRLNGERDGMITMPVARRYAFEGDTVRAFVLNPSTTMTKDKGAFCPEDYAEDNDDNIANSEEKKSESDDNEVQVNLDKSPKAFVISIVKQAKSREIVGSVTLKKKITIHGKNYYKLRPHDKRMPLVYIDVESCADFIKANQQNDRNNILYVVRVVETDVNGNCIGEMVREIGKEGILSNDLQAILLHNNLHNLEQFDQRMIDMYDEPYKPITAEELQNRLDLRKMCIFTIDPLTAKDLDDALSIEYKENGLYEVGIHISDVSHYLLEDTELDNIVKNRATSIYLANEVIHMLPKTLCMKCSLLPGFDKFAFSIFVQIKQNGEMVSHRIVRTVINSCTQFAYEHAQKFIDNPLGKFKPNELPPIYNGYTIEHIQKCVLMLHSLAMERRRKRYENGAISINNPKLRFEFDAETGEPAQFDVEQRQEANYMIEEFMLLANEIAGQFVYDHFPQTAILRNHGPPLGNGLKTVQEKLRSYGFEFDCSSSKAIYDSMHSMCAEAADPNAMYAYLCNALTKPMARATYICSKDKTPIDLKHYALCIPIYTHFTSPIRRYPDIMVHRQLAAALGYSAPSKRTADEFTELAKISNEQKYNAKCASDESAELFFKRYIKSQQSVVLSAVVYEIYHHTATVIIIKTGHVINLVYKDQKVNVDVNCAPYFILISEKNSKLQPLQLKVFSTVNVKLAVYDNKLVGYFASPDLKQRTANTKFKLERRLAEGRMPPPEPAPLEQSDNVPSGSSMRKLQNNCINHVRELKASTSSANGAPPTAGNRKAIQRRAERNAKHSGNGAN